MAATYSIGIDLGTTHCAVSYVRLDSAQNEPQGAPKVFPIPQLTAPGSVEAQPLLPSFLYMPNDAEFGDAQRTLPWGVAHKRIAGELARSHGAQVPLRLVSSAKSWLCHPDVDRRQPILPAGAPDEVQKLSPLDASAEYLAHLKAAWNHAMPDAPMEQQDVTLTVPASFDPVARELTAEAARRVGFTNLTLLEEPQAAFYAWLADNDWRSQVDVGDVVLIVDVGGGTTDLSLVVVKEEDGALVPHRIAVGDHILLGGDNMDLTLAYVVKAKLEQQGTQLDDWQMRALTLACRGAKEKLLSDSDVESVPLVIPSRGSKLIGGSIRTEVTLLEATQVLLEGFFPDVPVTDAPQQRTRTALTQMGLPYAQDVAITRHLAAFLTRHAGAVGATDFVRPTAVLFNGGVFKSEQLQNRVLHTVNGWIGSADGTPAARALTGADLDLACARGAGFFGNVGKSGGVRIRGGTAQAFYLGIESAMPAVPGLAPPVSALCIAPFGMEEGNDLAPPEQQFGLVVGEPVQFRFFGSSVRRQDEVGTLLDNWPDGELEELAPLEVTLSADGRKAGDVVPVKLQARVTEVGTLALEALSVSGPERWNVEFNLR